VKCKGFDLMTIEEKANWEYFKKNISHKDTLHSLIKKLALDFKIFGAISTEIIYNKVGNRIQSINHIDNSMTRIGKLTENEITHFFISDDWANLGNIVNEPKFLANYNPLSARIDRRQLVYGKRYAPKSRYYGESDWLACSTWVEIDAALGTYHLANINNGFHFSTWVKFGFVPSDEEKAQIINDIEGNHKGALNAGKQIYSFSESKDNYPEIEQLEVSNLDKTYDFLAKRAIDNISMSHKIPSVALLGIESNSTLGSTNELQTAFKLMENTVLKTDRKFIEDYLNKILSNMPGAYEIEIVPSDPIELTLSEGVLSEVMTIDEKRATVKSLPVLTDEEKQKLFTEKQTMSNPVMMLEQKQSIPSVQVEEKSIIK
jgi:hypothetical protein